MERLILRQPPDRFPKDRYGASIKRACSGVITSDCINVDDAAAIGFTGRHPGRYTDWTVYGVRRDRGGREGIFADIMAGDWQSRFDITRFAALDSLNEDWSLTDVDGREYDIESVVAAPRGGGRTVWMVYATRRRAAP